MLRSPPHLIQGRWLNYLGDDQGDDAVRGAYGPNYQRLAEIKRQYDPENVFRHNHNIPPGLALALGAYEDRSPSGSGGGSSSARRRWSTLRERTPISLPSSTTGHALGVVLLEEAKGLLERDVRADRVVGLLGDRGDGRRATGRGPRRRRARRASCG